MSKKKKSAAKVTSLGAMAMAIVFALFYPLIFVLTAWVLETEIEAASFSEFTQKLSHGPYVTAFLLDLLFSALAGLGTLGYFVFRAAITGWVGWGETLVVGAAIGAFANYMTPSFLSSNRPIWICAIAGIVAALACRAVLAVTPVLKKRSKLTASPERTP